jgi:hypothetical protein
VVAWSSSRQLPTPVPFSSKKGHAHGRTLALGRELDGGLWHRARGVEEHGAGALAEMGNRRSS